MGGLLPYYTVEVEMSKVYVITCGEYSDYHIETICSTREKAEETIKMMKPAMWGDERNIEEWAIDVIDHIPQDKSIYGVRMDRNGEVISAEICDAQERLWYGEAVAKEKESINSNDIGEGVFRGNLFLRVIAKDRTHAIKIVNEKRAALIMSGEWE